MLSRWKSKDKSDKTKSSSSSGKKKRKGRDNEDWHGDGRMDGGGGLSDGETGRGPVRGRSSRRDDPRRHTLAGNQLLLYPHHNPEHIAIEPTPPVPMNTPEYATINKLRDQTPGKIMNKKPPIGRYGPPTNNLLFDDDPGIMSEVETASTGFRRGGKQRSSLPVVRTPSKTLERPLAFQDASTQTASSTAGAMMGLAIDLKSFESFSTLTSSTITTFDSHPQTGQFKQRY